MKISKSGISRKQEEILEKLAMIATIQPLMTPVFVLDRNIQRRIPPFPLLTEEDIYGSNHLTKKYTNAFRPILAKVSLMSDHEKQ
jgi:hypothetical protein